MAQKGAKKKRSVSTSDSSRQKSIRAKKKLQKSESLVDALTKNGAFISLLLSPPDNAMILVTKKGQKSQNCVVGTKREKKFSLIKPNALDGVSSRA